MVRRFSADPKTATARAVHGDYWPTAEQLLASVVDLLAVANWQRVGKNTAPKPKPVPRPWLKTKTQHLGSDPVPIRSFRAWWDSKKRR